MNLGVRALLAILWLLHGLPIGVLSALGSALGSLLHALAKSRRRIAKRNVELCLPEFDAVQREALIREHFRWLGRSLLERGVFWYASRERIMSLIEIEGDVHLAERTPGPVMWVVPHFLALEAAACAVQLFQQRRAATIYQAQSNPVFDKAVRAGRERFGNSALFSRQESARPLMRAIRDGMVFFNLPDMDFGIKDAAFVPFFGVPAATLLAPSRMARSLGMTVQLVVAEMLEHGGWRVRFLPAWTDWPSEDALADTLRMNRWIEAEVRRNPAQYLWVHKRFKTRPEGEPALYG
ncbi:MAG: lipid A biosynthesis acyltransferase [Aquincola sp.]|nr:lipid A biosynthesis acyltransferase [Aquincola sp.]MDH4287200.1 lipid A biosynthesis acyltransferase [Aquincola sp.]MDH5328628.1 lipid A biosynthesis acyltransferase [Aquincola sp.]